MAASALHGLRGGAGRLWPAAGLGVRVGVGGPLRAASGSWLGAVTPPGSYPALSAQAARDPSAFWGPLARGSLAWDTPFHTVSDCDFASGKIAWFLGGRLNVSGEWAGHPDSQAPSESQPAAKPRQGPLMRPPHSEPQPSATTSSHPLDSARSLRVLNPEPHTPKPSS